MKLAFLKEPTKHTGRPVDPTKGTALDRSTVPVSPVDRCPGWIVQLAGESSEPIEGMTFLEWEEKRASVRPSGVGGFDGDGR